MMEQAQAAALPPPPEAAPRLAVASERVLIVDDNAINRRVLQGMLRKEQVTLLTAADGEEALAVARSEPPNLILLDIMMPAKDGYQVCAELKADPRTEHVPVIFLSALSETADKIKGLELGAVDYITKPFDQGEVLARVRSQLKIQRLSHDLRRANRELQDKQEHIDADLRAAAAIQRSLVPSSAPPVDGLRLAWRFIPCDRVGGDLFHFVPLPDGQLAVYVLDVAGHGVPAAMITVSLSQFLSPQAHHLADAAGAAFAPSVVLGRLDHHYPIERFDKYFTIAYALIDPLRGRLRYSLAGHPQPIVVRADGTIELLEAGGTIIGLGAPVPFDEGEVGLRPGDRVFLFTDGIAECENGAGDQFGDARLYEALRRGRGSLDEACDGLIEALHDFAGSAESGDDITLVGLEYAGPP